MVAALALSGALALSATPAASATLAAVAAAAEPQAVSSTLAAAPEPPPGALEAAVALPAEASVGQPVVIVVTVTNTGGLPVEVAHPWLAAAAAPGVLRRVAPPGLPAPAEPPIHPGEARGFAWTYEPAAPGPVAFTASIAGATGPAGTPVSATAWATLRVVRPAALETVLGVSATVAVPGQWVTLAVTLSNTGGAAAVGVLLPMPAPSTSRLAPVRGPVRVMLDRLGPGTATAFVWSWSVSGGGMASFFVRPSGRDANSGRVAAAGLVESERIRLLRPPALKLEHVFLLPNPVVRPGEFVEATLVVSNLGDVPALVTKVDIKETRSSSDSLGPPTLRSPQVPFDVPGGDSRSVVWAYRVGPAGNAKVAASIEGRDPGSGRTLKCPPVFSNRVLISATIFR